MPSRERVEQFVAMVEAGKFVEAIEEFYAERASMQENLGEKREGRATLVAHEKGVLTHVKDMRGRCVRPVFVDGDRVAINWIFEFTDPTGRARKLDEIAWQRWEGDRVVEERFYYDPSQIRG
jgi:hypothetical protein